MSLKQSSSSDLHFHWHSFSKCSARPSGLHGHERLGKRISGDGGDDEYDRKTDRRLEGGLHDGSQDFVDLECSNSGTKRTNIHHCSCKLEQSGAGWGDRFFWLHRRTRKSQNIAIRHDVARCLGAQPYPITKPNGDSCADSCAFAWESECQSSGRIGVDHVPCLAGLGLGLSRGFHDHQQRLGDDQ